MEFIELRIKVTVNKCAALTINIYIYLDFSKPAPTQKSHSETFAGNITAVPVNYGLATRHQRESLLTFPHLNWEFG